MDDSFLDDPNAIAKIVATAEPEDREKQRLAEWDDKTLAMLIAKRRHRESQGVYRAHEEQEWEDRVGRMSDEDLEIEDDIIRAKIDPNVKVSEQRLSWVKKRLNFIKRERERRELEKIRYFQKSRYLQRLQLMTDEVFLAEFDTIRKEYDKNKEEESAHYTHDDDYDETSAKLGRQLQVQLHFLNLKLDVLCEEQARRVRSRGIDDLVSR